MINEGKVYKNIDFQENEVMSLLHGTHQLYLIQDGVNYQYLK